MCYMKNKSCLSPSNMDSELCSGHTITWATCQFIVPPRKYKYFFCAMENTNSKYYMQILFCVLDNTAHFQ